MDLFNRLVISSMPLMPKNLVGQVAARYIAGERLADAVAMVRELAAEGAVATLDLLGEHCETPEQARQAARVYHDILQVIQAENLPSNISLKPTHLGLKCDYNLAKGLIEEIAADARERGNFLRIDMEDISCTDDTLRLYYELHEKYDNVGVVIQAYLRRTARDIDALKDVRANLRLCKGIYNEPRLYAYKNRAIIIRNFAYLLQELLSAGCYVGIATHCEETVWHAERIIRKLNLTTDKYEFQMLLGVDAELRQILLSAGHRLRVYIPFGEEWYAYSTRRLKENPQIAGAVAKNFLGLSKHGH